MPPQRKQRALPRLAAPRPYRWWQRLANGIRGIASVAVDAFLIAGLLAGATGTLAVLTTIQFGPPVGAILTFGPYGRPGPIWHVAAVRAVDHRQCVLQPAFMAAAPGSLVVEGRSGDGHTFRAHWAGGPTSDKANDCGSIADLNILLPAMQTLVDADTIGHQHWSFIGS